ncbi:MAG TPA: pitrilysin family protein [Gemmataceae bacterium]|jgi:predicted Zn-dependent peptidase|nr:pitrilysin family protein [Gemmataceae bacterium]
MTFHQLTLANGLQLIGETSPSAKSVAVGFFVRTGARDESPDVCGVTHFLEHMVFKGTPRRTAWDVNRDFDQIGANYNAFTSEENTVFYAAVLPEYLPQAVDILADILRPSLRDDDFNMEKNVIIEEIGMYEDQPMWSAYDNAKKHYFVGHPLGNSILGTPESITALTRDQMATYHARRYVAPNITAVAAGNFDWQRFIDLTAAACAKWNGGPVGRENVCPAVGPCSLKVLSKETVTQEHIVLMAPAPPADSAMRYAADTLALALGDDTGSRLYWALVDPGLAESADLSFSEYEGTGAFYASLTGDPERAAANVALVRKILADVQKNGLTAEELQTAKSKIGSRVVRAGERPMGRFQAIGMTWTYLRQYRSIDDDLKAFDAVTLDSVREVLDKYPIDRLTTLALGPLKEL